MGWNEWKEKISDASKAYAQKITDSSSALANKSAMLTTTADFAKLKSSVRRVIVIVGNEESPEYHSLLGRYPVFAAKAWVELVTIRYCDTTTSEELTKYFNVSVNPTVFAYVDGELAKKYETKELIDVFLKDFKIEEDA